ncbi:MAG: conjugal transfer protein TraH, partial [Pseudomonas sp.]|nr:conjugal transfer protein TraH [Pseudomonas sp.]
MTQRPRKLLLRLVSTVLASAIALTSMPSQAGLKEAVRGMYMSSVTDPQAVSTLRANGFYGGQVSVRPISQNFTVIQFSRPKIDAGCGGIDAFFGSFSFINGEQFQQLI